jgi:hypothetical protein
VHRARREKHSYDLLEWLDDETLAIYDFRFAIFDWHLPHDIMMNVVVQEAFRIRFSNRKSQIVNRQS